MGHWNYRIVKYADGSGYGLHEVYYDDNGEPKGYTENPCGFVTDCEGGGEREARLEILRAMARAVSDAATRDILDAAAHWPKR